MPADRNAFEHLRECLSEHFWDFGWNAVEFDGEPGTREHTDHLAGLALEALGLEQVGFYRPPSDNRIHVALEHRAGGHRHGNCVPVYRTAVSGRTGDTDA